MVRNGQYVDPQVSWSPMTKGLALSTPQELEPYLLKGKLLSTETNTALTCEKVVAKDPIKVQQVEVMVKDAHGNHALIQSWLTSFGPTPVILAPSKNAEVEVESQTTLSFTVHQAHVDEQWWKELLNHPAKFMIQQTFASAEVPRFSRIWSRRWMLGNRSVEPQMADTFSMLGSVLSTKSDEILKLSGTQKPPIFVSPLPNRQDDANSKWGGLRIVWIGREIETALLSMSTTKNHKGLVFKQPSFGIRVSEEDFPEVYKEIKHEAAPAVVPCNHRYMLDHVPLTIDAQKLESWSRTMEWPLRVLKRFNNGRFIVGAESHPVATQFAINSVPILHSLMKEVPQDSKPIIAGKLIMQQASGEDNNAVSSTLIEDPWFQKKLPANKSAPSTSQVWENYEPTQQAYGPYRGPTASSLPSDEAFKSQADRMTSIEADLASIKSHFDATQQANEGRFSRLQSDIQQMNVSLRTSLETALSEQSSQLIRTFEQLMKTSPRSNPNKPENTEARSRSPTRAGTN
eukprot:Skav210364  [mRNA]  locus=scaffold1357:140958:142502:- [translate_table: standard]